MAGSFLKIREFLHAETDTIGFFVMRALLPLLPSNTCRQQCMGEAASVRLFMETSLLHIVTFSLT